VRLLPMSDADAEAAAAQMATASAKRARASQNTNRQGIMHEDIFGAGKGAMALATPGGVKKAATPFKAPKRSLASKATKLAKRRA